MVWNCLSTAAWRRCDDRQPGASLCFSRLTWQTIAGGSSSAKVGCMTVFNHFSLEGGYVLLSMRRCARLLRSALSHRNPRVSLIEAPRLLAHRAVAEQEPWVEFRFTHVIERSPLFWRGLGRFATNSRRLWSKRFQIMRGKTPATPSPILQRVCCWLCGPLPLSKLTVPFDGPRIATKRT